jgi:bifunctional UDP-N-acetylglucosamine pyrophosphorylase/glucosamine-1-phosphate N-acetyltransferase
VNLGCGVVFVNYDGSQKYRSQVGDGAFIGCNSNLVSPVTVGEGAYIAAGSTVTEDVEADALYIARAKGVKKPGWVSLKGILKKKK